MKSRVDAITLGIGDLEQALRTCPDGPGQKNFRSVTYGNPQFPP